MPPRRTLVIVLAGGAGGRLELLTRSRAKPAVPFGGNYRLIDFPLSNALHSGLSDVWVIEQFNPVSLTDHLANGRPWDLDRTTGGLLVLHPRLGEGAAGGDPGTAGPPWGCGGLAPGNGGRALAQRVADPAVWCRVPRRGERGRRLPARLLRCRGRAPAHRGHGDDGHHPCRAGGCFPVRRGAGRRRRPDHG